jgi:hypothetical protein
MHFDFLSLAPMKIATTKAHSSAGTIFKGGIMMIGESRS